MEEFGSSNQRKRMFERSSQWKKRKLIFNSVKFIKKEENQSSKCVLTVSLLLSVKKLECFIVLKPKNLKKQFSEIEVRAPISYLYEKMPHTRKKRRYSNVKNFKKCIVETSSSSSTTSFASSGVRLFKKPLLTSPLNTSLSSLAFKCYLTQRTLNS